MTGKERTTRLSKNIIFSFVLRGGNILTQILLIPKLVFYLDSTKYGVWVTVGSILAWFSFFDFGLSNGLRNKYAQSVAIGDITSARKYISNTYIALFTISIILILILVILQPFINWAIIFNARKLEWEINALAFIVILLFLIQFILRTIGTILVASQKQAANDLILLLSNIFGLTLLYIFSNFKDNSLIIVGISLSIAPTIVYLLFNYVLFYTSFKEYKPKILDYDSSYIKNILNLGFKFFFIQIAGVVLFTSHNFIVNHLLSPAEVTPYSIAFKLFNYVLMGSTIIVTPFWAAATEAYFSKDFKWIKRIVNKFKIVWLFTVILTIIILWQSENIYRLWVGEQIQIPFKLSLLMAVYTIILSFNNIYIFFINGSGKIKLQTIVSIIVSIITIPLSAILIEKYEYGSEAVILSTCICLLPTIYLWPKQYKLLINEEAYGIWNA